MEKSLRMKEEFKKENPARGLSGGKFLNIFCWIFFHVLFVCVFYTQDPFIVMILKFEESTDISAYFHN